MFVALPFVATTTMKLIVFGCLFAFVAVVSCIGNDPLLVVPYCIDTQNAYLTRDADYIDFTAITVPINTGNPIYRNGQNYGLDGNENFNDAWDRNPEFYGVGQEHGNGTLNLFTEKGFLWDFGFCLHRTQDNKYGFGLIDGSRDTVDGAMQFTVNDTFYYMSPYTNISCQSDGLFRVDLENPDIPFVAEHYYYVPNNPDLSWARVVNKITNPKNQIVGAAIGYWNHAGGLTYLQKRTTRYVVTADNADETKMHDNPMSIHWNGPGAKLNKVLYGPDGEPADGGQWIKPYFEVNVPASGSMTFMMILVQGNMSQSFITDLAIGIDANPLVLYNKMTDDQLDTLQNFNPCKAVPPNITVTELTSCVKPSNKAEVMTDWWLDFPLVISDSTGKDFDVVNEAFDIAEGKYNISVRISAKCGTVKVYEGEIKCAPAPKSSAAPTNFIISFALICIALFFTF